MKKLIAEFKAFINKGSVMDLAVGMIIGSAFTAIVTSLVKNILTPLINWIPGANGMSGLQTVLRQAVLDESGNVVSPAVILDWGAVISAVVTFFFTAVILFIIVKTLNKIKEASAKVAGDADELFDKVKREIKEKNNGDKKTQNDEKPKDNESEKAEINSTKPTIVAEKTEENTTAKVAEKPQESQSTEELLKQIIVLLEKNGK